MASGCHVCRKHGAMAIVPGGEVLADEHVVVSHHPLTTPSACHASVPLGHLLVEPRRHVGAVEELGPEEAASLERLTARACGALRSHAGADEVEVTDAAGGSEHLQRHLLPAGAEQGDAQDVIALAARLRGG